MRRLGRISLMIVLVVALVSGSILTSCGPEEGTPDEFQDQPENTHSNICCYATPAEKDAESVVDVNFAKELHDALGNKFFHSMIITFGQCFGGGIMDDVADKFAASIRPISMTAGAKHDEPSGSRTATLRGAKNDGSGRWSQAYVDVHPGKTGGVNKNPTESEAYERAKKTDVWKNSSPMMTAQLKTLNKGGEIKLGEGASYYRAILFAGNTVGRADYWNDIARHYSMLTKSGYEAEDIMILYGNGTVPSNAVEPAVEVRPDEATRENLIDAIDRVGHAMTIYTQLYIFIMDHGSADQGTDTLPKPKTVVPSPEKNGNNTFKFSPLSDYLIDALESPYNTSGPYIELNVEFMNIWGMNWTHWQVLFNDRAEWVNGGDYTFPDLSPEFEGALRFPIDSGAINLAGENYVWLKNSQSDDPRIEVEIYLSMGDIATVVDETIGDQITIGAVRSLSGGLEMIGDYALGPILEYWVNEVNDAGGINVAGSYLPVELDIQDDGSDVDTMTDLLTDMIDSGDYDFVFAPVGTDFFQAAAPIYNDAGYILMGAEGSCGLMMDTLDELPYVFGVLNFAAHNQIKVLARMLGRDMGANTAFIVFSDDWPGHEYAQWARFEFENQGITEFFGYHGVPPDPAAAAAMLPAIIAEARDTKPDVFCAFTYPPTTAAVVEQAIALDTNFPAMVLGWGANFQYFYDTFGPYGEGVVALGGWNEQTSPQAAAFAADMIAMHGRDYMDWWGGLYYYAGLQCFQQAIERAGTLDQSVIRDILATQHFTTVLGDTWFEDANGNHPIAAGGGILADECHPGEIGQWQNGIFEVVGYDGITADLPNYEVTSDFIFPMTDQWGWLQG